MATTPKDPQKPDVWQVCRVRSDSPKELQASVPLSTPSRATRSESLNLPEEGAARGRPWEGKQAGHRYAGLGLFTTFWAQNGSNIQEVQKTAIKGGVFCQKGWCCRCGQPLNTEHWLNLGPWLVTETECLAASALGAVGQARDDHGL